VSVVVQAAGCDFRSAVLCKRCLGAQMSTLVTGSLDMGARLTTFDHSLPTRLRLSASVALSFGGERRFRSRLLNLLSIFLPRIFPQTAIPQGCVAQGPGIRRPTVRWPWPNRRRENRAAFWDCSPPVLAAALPSDAPPCRVAYNSSRPALPFHPSSEYRLADSIGWN
jgi:hypothetical protein